MEDNKINSTTDPMTESFQAAVDKAIANTFAKGLPVAKLDENRKPYWLYADGHREYPNECDFMNKRPDKIIAPDGTEIEIVYDAEPDAMTLSFQAAVDQAKADLRAKGLPVAILDENGKSCLEYADGRRKYRT